jgi:hypothetical protein
MAECVSCGKDIQAGKFFCDDCYVNMKGRRVTLKKVSQAPTTGPGGAQGDGSVSGNAEVPQEASVPEGVMRAKSASGSLTPAAGKKVVAFKPATEKTVREKGKAGKKRFTLTISFSERTYEAFARLGGRKAGRRSPEAGEAGRDEVSRGRSSRAAAGRGPYGRTRLKAVSGMPGAEEKRKSGIMRILGYRDRSWDKGDLAAAAVASFSAAAIVALSFMSWVRLVWGDAEGEAMLTVQLRGVDLGAMAYACIALAVTAIAYMVATLLFQGPFTKIDYGVVMMVAGIAIIPLFYAAIAPTTRLLRAGLEQLGMVAEPLPAQYQRQTLWPAYAMLIMGAAMAFSGLVRISERSGKSDADR